MERQGKREGKREAERERDRERERENNRDRKDSPNTEIWSSSHEPSFSFVDP